MVKIDISNRSFILIGVLLLIIIAGGVVIAYNSNPANPSIMGHSLNEIDLPSCTTGQTIVKQADGNWACGSGGSPTIITVCSNVIVDATGYTTPTAWTSSLLPSGLSTNKLVETYCMAKGLLWASGGGFDDTMWRKVTNHAYHVVNQYNLDTRDLRCWCLVPGCSIKSCVSYISD
jgi:hypothetical protein